MQVLDQGHAPEAAPRLPPGDVRPQRRTAIAFWHALFRNPFRSRTSVPLRLTDTWPTMAALLGDGAGQRLGNHHFCVGFAYDGGFSYKLFQGG